MSGQQKAPFRGANCRQLVAATTSILSPSRDCYHSGGDHGTLLPLIVSRWEKSVDELIDLVEPVEALGKSFHG